ncbi:hypothetical protein O181_116567 [Austropuccinia psidii MF-1]|uniref:Uncharacterized protein n=1 Tax=Austropuccinia psidii MF-1 TaxID=1389203 RepID=A0A9Q3K9L0_9BASI|nr:hypothetical protein [Austropuccinia psidii MF-1]
MGKKKSETASTATSIIPDSTANSNYDSTVIITQNNQLEPISSEFIKLDIGNTLQKAKNLANNQAPAITPQAAPKKGYRRDYGTSQSVTEGQGAETATRSLSGHIQSQPEGLQQCISAQRVPHPCRSVEKLQEFLPDCEKIPGPSQHLQFTYQMASIDGKAKHDACTAEWRKNNPPPPKQVPKIAPVARSSNFSVKDQPQAQNKGKGKAPTTNLTASARESQGISRSPWTMYFI